MMSIKPELFCFLLGFQLEEREREREHKIIFNIFFYYFNKLKFLFSPSKGVYHMFY